MATITELGVFSSLLFGGYTAQAGGSTGSNDLLLILTPDPTISFCKLNEINTTVNVSFGFNTYYKMQGYNEATQEYEVWHCMGTPLFNPPSGNTLSNISVVTSWTDR